MSHVVTCELEVKDLAAMGAACEAMGAKLVLGQRTYKWFGQWLNDYQGDDAAFRKIDPKQYGKCDHAIRHPGCNYEIGLMKQANGSYMLIADEWHDGSLVEKFGKGLSKLKQQYAAAVAMKTMRTQGFRVQSRLDESTGDLRLICTR
jgi:hypothetical protein